MRSLLLALGLAAALALPAHAQFTVDVPQRIIETSKLRLQFDLDCPERIRGLWYRPFSNTSAVTGGLDTWEFSGQMIQGLWSGQGPIFTQAITSQSWNVIQQSATQLTLRIESQSTWGTLQPRVRTDYTFFADSSGYQVTRTMYAGEVAYPTTSLQPYVLRLGLGVVNSGQFRTAGGVLTAVGYCGGGCQTADWDQRWTRTEGPGLAATVMYATVNPHPMNLMGDYDNNSASAWSTPLSPVQTWSSNVTWRMFVHFSTTPGNDALEDAVYTWFDGLPVAGVPAARLAPFDVTVSPNPASAATTIAYSLPEAGDVAVDVLDVTGRRVALLESGAAGAGAHQVRWNGLDTAGRRTAAGVYFARVHAAGSQRLVRIARVN